MMVLGIDPGLEGGLALYDKGTTRLLSVDPMPTQSRTLKTYSQRTEKQKERGEPRKLKTRRVIDAIRLDGLIMGCYAAGADLVVIEEIGIRPGQMGGVTAGYGAGLIFMCCYKANFRIEVVQAAEWKRAMRIPANKLEAVAKAELMFPLDRMLFRTSAKHRDTLHDGWAEAAMLARYGAEYL